MHFETLPIFIRRINNEGEHRTLFNRMHLRTHNSKICVEKKCLLGRGPRAYCALWIGFFYIAELQRYSMCHIFISVQRIDHPSDVEYARTAFKGWNAYGLAGIQVSIRLHRVIWIFERKKKTTRKDERKKWIIKRSFYNILIELKPKRYNMMLSIRRYLFHFDGTEKNDAKTYADHKISNCVLEIQKKKKSLSKIVHRLNRCLSICHTRTGDRSTGPLGRKLKETRTLGLALNFAVHIRIRLSIAAMHAFCSRVGTQQQHKEHTYKCTKYMP